MSCSPDLFTVGYGDAHIHNVATNPDSTGTMVVEVGRASSYGKMRRRVFIGLPEWGSHSWMGRLAKVLYVTRGAARISSKGVKRTLQRTIMWTEDGAR